jgi:hypothetical protein
METVCFSETLASTESNDAKTQNNIIILTTAINLNFSQISLMSSSQTAGFFMSQTKYLTYQMKKSSLMSCAQ